MAEFQTRSLAVTARIVHLALVMGVLLFLGVAVLLRSSMPASAPNITQLLQLVAFVVGAAAVGVALVFRGKIPPRQPAESIDAWWQANLSRAILLWALTEGPSLFGVVAFLLTGSYAPLVVTGVGLILLATMAPARLAGD